MNDPQMNDRADTRNGTLFAFRWGENLNNGWQGLFRGDPKKFSGAKLVTAWQRLGRPIVALLF
jgi:prepilin signal peptidase PulO-like enzyme (type II secretory pathway)